MIKKLKVPNVIKHDTSTYSSSTFPKLVQKKKNKSLITKILLLKLVIEHTNEIQFEQRGKTTAISAGEQRDVDGHQVTCLKQASCRSIPSPWGATTH